jgi:hypothetical protein
MQKVRRFLSRYRKGSDRPEKEEIDLSNVPLKILQGIFEQPESELMYVIYDVKSHHAKALEPYLSESLDLQQFDYFLETEQVK